MILVVHLLLLIHMIKECRYHDTFALVQLDLSHLLFPCNFKDKMEMLHCTYVTVLDEEHKGTTHSAVSISIGNRRLSTCIHGGESQTQTYITNNYTSSSSHLANALY
jgi:hypothetical protein